MAKVFLDAVAPIGVDDQLVAAALLTGRHEEGTPGRQVAVVGLHVLVVLGAIVEQVDFDDIIDRRQFQLFANLVLQPFEFLEQLMVLREIDIGNE